MEPADVLYNDFKLYTVDDKTLGIGQFFTTNFDEISKDLENYLSVLDKEAEANNYSLLALYITDIIKNGSYVLYNRKAKDLMDQLMIWTLVKENIYKIVYLVRKMLFLF